MDARSPPMEVTQSLGGKECRGQLAGPDPKRPLQHFDLRGIAGVAEDLLEGRREPHAVARRHAGEARPKRTVCGLSRFFLGRHAWRPVARRGAVRGTPVGPILLDAGPGRTLQDLQPALGKPKVPVQGCRHAVEEVCAGGEMHARPELLGDRGAARFAAHLEEPHVKPGACQVFQT